VRHYLRHETKRHVLIRFAAVVLILAGYFAFVSIRYGLTNGVSISALTWSFFVLCTPVADAGILLDFPIRLAAKVRMIYTEIGVWVLALALSFTTVRLFPEVYDTTVLLRLFRHILLRPFPFWGIIVISAVGTFASVYFGDELIDVVKHEHREKHRRHRAKYRILLFLFIFAAAAALYHFLLKELGVALPL
jgi:hypothetical protein